MHVVGAGLALLSLAFIGYRWRAVAVPVATAAVAIAIWDALRVSRAYDRVDLTPDVIVTLVCVEVAAAAMFVACSRLRVGRWIIPPWGWLVFVGVPVVVAGSLSWQLFVDPDNYRRSFGYVLHVAYGFGLMIAAMVAIYPRRNDPSHHVAAVSRGFLIGGLAMLTAQVVLPPLTGLIAVPLLWLVVWASRHRGEWSRSASRGAELIDAIGAFIFVTSRDGRLLDWNGPGERLIRLMTGRQAERGADVFALLGSTGRPRDGSIIDLELDGGGMLRTQMAVQLVDPVAPDRDVVLLLRPVHATVGHESFPPVDGHLDRHDPATETLAPSTAAQRIADAARAGRPVLRCDVTPHDDIACDDLMFLVARRLETRLPGWTWGRADQWTFVATTDDPHPDAAALAAQGTPVERATLRVLRAGPHESPTDFVARATVPAVPPDPREQPLGG